MPRKKRGPSRSVPVSSNQILRDSVELWSGQCQATGVVEQNDLFQVFILNGEVRLTDLPHHRVNQNTPGLVGHDAVRGPEPMYRRERYRPITLGDSLEQYFRVFGHDVPKQYPQPRGPCPPTAVSLSSGPKT